MSENIQGCSLEYLGLRITSVIINSKETGLNALPSCQKCPPVK